MSPPTQPSSLKREVEVWMKIVKGANESFLRRCSSASLNGAGKTPSLKGELAITRTHLDALDQPRMP